jgi:SAM-dependent methyltransferase
LMTMESRWESEWRLVDSAGDVAALATNENWLRIRSHMPSGRILEAGCGIAKWVAFLDRVGYETHGLDYSAIAIRKSLGLWPKLRLAQGDLRAMPYADAFFDGIVSFGAIEHDVNGPQDSLTEMYRVLRPAGVLYCTVPCMNWIRRAGYLALQNWVVRNQTIRRLSGRGPDVMFFEYVFTPAEYVKALEAAGFEVVELVPLDPYCLASTPIIRRMVKQVVHKQWPWCLAHMMAAVCRK